MMVGQIRLGTGPWETGPWEIGPWETAIVEQIIAWAAGVFITCLGAGFLYLILFYLLRSIFRKFDNDAALVTLNLSLYPILAITIFLGLKYAFSFLMVLPQFVAWVERILDAGVILTLGYWFSQLFVQVVAYYSKAYAQETEAMWDDVLIPLLETVVPVIVAIITGFLLLRTFGVDLTGIWITLGGATFVIGFAVQDILANFFSGVVLLVDTPFQFGDVLRLEDGSMGLLRRIGVRVTHLYLLDDRCDTYIPNSVLQAQRISNLSRPTPHFHDSITIPLRLEKDHDIKVTKALMQEIVLAHPDTLGEIDRKLKCLEQFYLQDQILWQAKEMGRLRLEAESEVNLKLEEVQQMLEVLAVTLQFAEKGGINPEELQSIREEYQSVLALIGVKVMAEQQGRRTLIRLEETQTEESLIELIRKWYRIWLRDPNLGEQDQYLLPTLWERTITIFKRRVQRLSQKIANPLREETRLDDYVQDLKNWLQQQLKETSGKWLEPKILVTGIGHDEDCSFVEFTLSYHVDDARLEDCERGSRVRSEIYQELMLHFKPMCISKETSIENLSKFQNTDLERENRKL
jgi:MscS family membrane protein